jgi:hypothetical protein
MKKAMVKGIKWNIGMEEIMEKLDDMSIEEAANALDVPVNYFKKLSESEQHDYAYDFFNHRLDSNAMKAEFMGIPLEAVIPNELADEFEKTGNDENINDYLSDEFEFDCCGFDKIERVD